MRVAVKHRALPQRGRSTMPAISPAMSAIAASRPGAPISYTVLAARAGIPGAARAAGAACAANLVAPVVPCHRALRSDGSLGGYYYGLARKEWLLRHEAGA